jgi:PAS domain S-box-containing protein
MKAAALPANEQARLDVLHRYQILDTGAEQAFDDFTTLASQICESPIALITFVDATRHWFKAKCGLDASETTRELGFCAHALLEPEELLIIPNALHDERFADNPLVTQDPHIRFYAGAPLVTPDGYPLGTICVIDRVTRQLKPEQQDALRVLAKQVINQLELRLALDELATMNQKMHDYLIEVNHVTQAAAALEKGDFEMADLDPIAHRPDELGQLARGFQQVANLIAERKQAEESLRLAEENYRSIFENAVEGIFQSSPEGHFINVNPALAKIYGYDSPSEMIESITNISEQLYVDAEQRAEFIAAIERYGTVKDFEYRCYCKDGSIIWTQVDARVVRNGNSEVLYYEGIVQDITERKRREDQLRQQLKELQIEIDHQKRAEEVATLTASSYFQEVKQEVSVINLDEFWG